MTKLCIDCRWHEKAGTLHFCYAPENKIGFPASTDQIRLALVTGVSPHGTIGLRNGRCEDQRNVGAFGAFWAGLCGKTGRWYSPLQHRPQAAASNPTSEFVGKPLQPIEGDGK